MKDIYTIGHSSHSTEYFLELLKKYDIDSVVDIRSVPFSKYVPHFNKLIIKRILNVNKIHCIYMGEELGIQQKGEDLCCSEGYLELEKVISSINFIDGLFRINNGIDKGHKICIMCTEKDPIDCHRSVLLSKELKRQGHSVKHILADGSIESHKDFEERLLDLYFSSGSQENMFQPIQGKEHKKELLELAYAKRYRDLVKALK